MPDRDLLARLDAMGASAAAESPPMPDALTTALAARSARRAVHPPFAALAAAAAVIVAGAALVLLKPTAVAPRETADAPASGEPLTLLSMMERYNRAGSVDAALSTPTGRAGGWAIDPPVARAIDARSGQLPE